MKWNAMQTSIGVRVPEYKVGQKVWVETDNIDLKRPSKKLAERRIGPYEILEIISPNAIKLKLPWTVKLHPVMNVSQLCPYKEPRITGQEATPAPPVEINGELEYEVEQILDSRLRHGQLQYLVNGKVTLRNTTLGNPWPIWPIHRMQLMCSITHIQLHPEDFSLLLISTSAHMKTSQRLQLVWHLTWKSSPKEGVVLWEDFYSKFFDLILSYHGLSHLIFVCTYGHFYYLIKDTWLQHGSSMAWQTWGVHMAWCHSESAITSWSPHVVHI